MESTDPAGSEDASMRDESTGVGSVLIREAAAAQAWRRSLTLAFLPTRERK